ncbi:MAG TPA: hypothetical protein VFM59_01810 [Salinimicrobium sp.]|nr:hypothetical protein [Salinimicrobium sp.]
MKRYFIFGFLTILIITLNFAFIIILTSNNVDIDYRILFILWIVVVLAAIGLAWMERNKKKKSEEDLKAAAEVKPEEHLRPTEEHLGPSVIYKNKLIKKFRFNLVSELTPKVEAGFFGGYIVTEEYANEAVQAVYTQEEQLLGYISKKDEQLCQNLEQLYKEPVICWGNISWNDIDKTYQVKAHVPILYNENEIHRFSKLVSLKNELIRLEKSSEYEVFAFLEKAEQFYYLQQSEIVPNSLDHSIDPEILPLLSQKLLEENQWEKLLELKRFPILISRLEPEKKKEVKSAIKLAKKQLQK